jgi:hypothetical protein
MRHREEQLVRPPLLIAHPDQPPHPRPSIHRMLEKMGFPDPEALREFIVNTPWRVDNYRPMIYLLRLSAQGKFSFRGLRLSLMAVCD